jgi:hypothetical protein
MCFPIGKVKKSPGSLVVWKIFEINPLSGVLKTPWRGVPWKNVVEETQPVRGKQGYGFFWEKAEAEKVKEYIGSKYLVVVKMEIPWRVSYGCGEWQYGGEAWKCGRAGRLG